MNGLLRTATGAQVDGTGCSEGAERPKISGLQCHRPRPFALLSVTEHSINPAEFQGWVDGTRAGGWHLSAQVGGTG